MCSFSTKLKQLCALISAELKASQNIRFSVTTTFHITASFNSTFGFKADLQMDTLFGEGHLGGV